MKEFCLVPRKVAEKYLFKDKVEVQTGGKVFGKKKRKKAHPTQGKVVKLNTKPKQIINPPLDYLVRIKFKLVRHREYASSLLTYFQNKSGVHWDEDGNLLSPINNYNLIDIISDLIQGKQNLSPDKMVSYKMLLDYVNIPQEFIENKKARTQLYGAGLNWLSYA